MNIKLFRLVLSFVACMLASYAHAEIFECAFLQERYATGKPNKASCSMLPEKVYSTSRYTHKKTEHCNVESVYSYEDIEDVVIDTKQGVVSWKTHYGITEDAKPRQKKYYLKQGDSEEEANKKVNLEKEEKEYFQIKSHLVSEQRIWIDDVTGKVLSPPKIVPEHNLMFTDGRSMFYLYIPESSGHAILLEPTGMADASWVSMRFGKCRIKQ